MIQGIQRSALERCSHRVQGRRAREAGRKVRFAGLDQLDRAPDHMRGVCGGQDLVEILLAAKAPTKQRLMNHHVDLAGILAQRMGQEGGQRHARERRALITGVNVPGAIDFVCRGV